MTATSQQELNAFDLKKRTIVLIGKIITVKVLNGLSSQQRQDLKRARSNIETCCSLIGLGLLAPDNFGEIMTCNYLRFSGNSAEGILIGMSFKKSIELCDHLSHALHLVNDLINHDYKDSVNELIHRIGTVSGELEKEDILIRCQVRSLP